MLCIRPSEIYFSQDSISNVFGNHCQQHKGKQIGTACEGCQHRCKHIGTTLDQLCEGQITVSVIPPMGVTKKAGRWYSGDNRRLWIFREMEKLGKCTHIFVKLTRVPPKKFTTLNRGESVRVRGDPGGSWHLKTSASTNMMPIQSNRPQFGDPIKINANDKNETVSSYSIQADQPRSALPRSTTTTAATRGKNDVYKSFLMTNDDQANTFQREFNTKPATAASCSKSGEPTSSSITNKVQPKTRHRESNTTSTTAATCGKRDVSQSSYINEDQSNTFYREINKRPTTAAECDTMYVSKSSCITNKVQPEMYHREFNTTATAIRDYSDVYPSSSYTQSMCQYERCSSIGLYRYQYQHEGPRRRSTTRPPGTYQRASTWLSTSTCTREFLHDVISTVF